MKKNRTFRISFKDNPSYHWSYGSCAHIAIASLFDIDSSKIYDIVSSLRIRNHREGLTYQQCRRVISYLSKYTNKKVEYLSNLDLSFGAYIYFNREGSHLILLS